MSTDCCCSIPSNMSGGHPPMCHLLDGLGPRSSVPSLCVYVRSAEGTFPLLTDPFRDIFGINGEAVAVRRRMDQPGCLQ